jgi:hypothetical protein
MLIQVLYVVTLKLGSSKDSKIVSTLSSSQSCNRTYKESSGLRLAELLVRKGEMIQHT